MAMQLFSIKHLDKVDFGSIAESLDRRLAQAAQDCLDRPGVKTAREVQLVIRMTPQPVTRGSTVDLDHVTTEFEIRAKVPCERSIPIFMEPMHGGLAFNPDLPSEPTGKTLFDDQEKEEDDAARDG